MYAIKNFYLYNKAFSPLMYPITTLFLGMYYPLFRDDFKELVRERFGKGMSFAPFFAPKISPNHSAEPLPYSFEILFFF